MRSAERTPSVDLKVVLCHLLEEASCNTCTSAEHGREQQTTVPEEIYMVAPLTMSRSDLDPKLNFSCPKEKTGQCSGRETC